MSHRPAPPRIASWLAARLVPRLADDAALGDLHERYLERLHRDGPAAARAWYRCQTIGFLTRLPLARIRAAAVRMRPTAALTGVGADLRHATRAILRQRDLTAAVVIVLGLAVGAMTTAFSLINGVLIQPLPFAAPDALVMIWDEYPPADGVSEPKPVTMLQYRAWRDRRDAFASVGAFESIPAVIQSGEWPEQVDAALVTADLFHTLGVRPVLGRLFVEEDEALGAALVVILSEGMWRARFGADPAILSRSIRIDGQDTRVVGVMPAGFWFYDPYAATRSYAGSSASAAQLWRPLGGRFGDEIDYPRYRVIARLRPDVSRDTATAVVSAAERALAPQLKDADGRVRVVSLAEQIVAPVRPRLIGLGVAGALVLLVAAVNLVSLLVAGCDARRADLAVRAALGATRGRLARALVIQAAVLSLIGGAAGVFAAFLGVPILRELVPRGLPLAHRVTVDGTAVFFALAVAVAVGVIVAGMASWRLGAAELGDAIASRSRAVAGTVRRQRLTKLTIAAEVGLTLVLVIAATLLLRSLVSTYARDPGFDPHHTLTFRSVLMLRSVDGEPDFSFFDRLEAQVATLPGVESVGSGALLPFSRWGQTAMVRAGSMTEPQRVNYRRVSPGYFDALRVSLRAGRLFTRSDVSEGPAVAIVNQAFADRYLGGGTPTRGSLGVVSRGRVVQLAIVGTVGNVLEWQLFADPRPIVYVPIAQSEMPMRQFAVRVSGEPLALVEAIRRAAAEVDPNQPLRDFITLDALVAQSMEEEHFYGAVTSAFAAIAVLLAVAGLYGVVSFATRQRDREVGVRIALGSSRAAVYRLILVDGMRPVAVGLVAGCAAAVVATRYLQSLLHGVPAVDVVSYATSALGFAFVAGLACLVPAGRAARIDPTQTLSRGT